MKKFLAYSFILFFANLKCQKLIFGAEVFAHNYNDLKLLKPFVLDTVLQSSSQYGVYNLRRDDSYQYRFAVSVDLISKNGWLFRISPGLSRRNFDVNNYSYDTTFSFKLITNDLLLLTPHLNLSVGREFYRAGALHPFLYAGVGATKMYLGKKTFSNVNYDFSSYRNYFRKSAPFFSWQVRGGLKFYNLTFGAMFEQSFADLDKSKGLGKIRYYSYLYFGADLYRTKWFAKKIITKNAEQSDIRLSSKQLFGKYEHGFGLYEGIFYFPIQSKFFANYKSYGSYQVISWNKSLSGATSVPGFFAFYLRSINKNRTFFGQANLGLGFFTIKAPAAFKEYTKGSSTPDNNTGQDVAIKQADYVDEKYYYDLDLMLGVRTRLRNNASVNFAGGIRNLFFGDDAPAANYLPTVRAFQFGLVGEATLRIKHIKLFTSLSRSLNKQDQYNFLKTMYYLNIGIAYDKYVN